METQTPSLRIRRASPLDAVNLYKLLVDEEIKSGTAVPHDDTARIADILNTIATGYVSVVEKSGRIVGSLGFAAGGEPYALSKILDSKWAFLVPALGNTRVPEIMADRLVAFADKYGAGIRMTLKAGPNRLVDFLEDRGFVAVTQQLIREPVNVEQRDADDRAEDAAIAGRVPDVQDDELRPADERDLPEESGDSAPAVRSEPAGEPVVQEPTPERRKANRRRAAASQV